MPAVLDAGYFDGRTSRRHPVRLQVGPGGLEIAGTDGLRTVARAGIRVSEPLGAAPRTLSFADGSYCEAPQGAALDRLLAELGQRDGAVVRWQSSWRSAVAATLAVALLLAAGYRWGLPWGAAQLAPRLPQALAVELSDQVMAALDRHTLAASSLAEPRRRELGAAFQRLAAADPALPAPQLLFRRGGAVGPNAFALPDGRIVLQDELVALSGGDGEVLAVLAHELGHVKHRHGLRQLIQSSVVAAIAAGYFGDVSSLLSGLGALLLESQYSRSFELEADDYGAALLRAAGRDAADLAAILAKLEHAHAARQGTVPAAVGDWLSSHPDTVARLSRLRPAP